MKYRLFILLVGCISPLFAASSEKENLHQQIQQLQQQTQQLQTRLNRLQTKLVEQSAVKTAPKKVLASQSKNKPLKSKIPARTSNAVHSSVVTIHRLDNDPESLEFYPTALVADEHVVTYIAGTPVVTSPYLGSRPAFDGSDYIVNISSINRDIRLMQQRRRLDRAYEGMGYDTPHRPIIALSGKVEPIASIGQPFSTQRNGDLTLGSSELDIAAILNDTVEAFMALSFDASPPDTGGQRVSNSSIDLNLGFINIGNLDVSPFYFTGGQMYVPFGRFSTAMVSAPLTMILARTKTRPFILGYKSQKDSGPFAAVYGFRSDTTLGNTGVGGVNLGYIFDTGYATGEIGGSFISSINNAAGMQFSGATPLLNFGNFGGFSSITNGSEYVKQIPGAGVHGYLSVDRYNFTAEWVGATSGFRPEDLSFNGRGAHPQAGQLEASMTFKAWEKPASVGLGYQWSQQALALNLPKNRISGVFNISLWKDTVESLEYRYDMNYGKSQYANGAAPDGYVNANTIGPGGAYNTLLAQIGVYF